MRRAIGLWLAVAAQAVNAPRLILVYLRVDGITPPAWLEIVLLALTGIATSLVLSGGGAYLAHTLATPTKRGGAWKAALAGIWLVMLGCAVILIAPLLQSGMQETTVARTLGSLAAQWTWSIVAVLAIEIVAAGSMLADALRADTLPRRRGGERERGRGGEGENADGLGQMRADAGTLRTDAGAHEPARTHTDGHGAASSVVKVAALTYRCGVCGKNSMSQPQLAAHMRWQHSTTNGQD